MSATTAAPRSKNIAVAAKVNEAATTALAWAKALATKALVAAKGGWAYAWTMASTAVRKNAFGISLGASMLLASEKGYKAIVNAMIGTVKIATKASVGSIHFMSRAVGFIGKHLTSLVSKVHKGAGQWVQGTTWTITGTITSAADSVKSLADTIINKFTVSALSSIVTRTVNFFSMALFAGIAGNAVTGGALATTAASIPVAGGLIASLVAGGAVSLIALGAVALAGISYTLVFRAQEAQNEADAERIDELDADSLDKFEEAERLRAATKAGRKLASAQAALA